MSQTTTSKRATAAVIGGGPAGATAAFTLARAGVDVVLLEASQHPRPKACAGGLTRRAWQLLPDGLDVQPREHCHRALLRFREPEAELQAQRPEPLVTTVERSTFDHALTRLAQDAGADVWMPCSALAVHHRGHHVELETTRGNLLADFVIIADGALSPSARAAGWTRRQHLVPALVAEVDTLPDARDRFEGLVRFDVGLVPDGYGWVFPHGDRLSVGLISMRSRVNRPKDVLGAYLRHLGLDGQARMEGALVPVRPRRPPLIKGRVMLAGDAAGLADPITAEGIANALLSGRLAAEAVVGGDGDPWQVQYRYESSLDEQILSELRLARLLATLFYRFPQNRTWLLETFGQESVELLADLFSGTTTYHRILLRPRSYTRAARLWWRKRKQRKAAAPR